MESLDHKGEKNEMEKSGDNEKSPMNPDDNVIKPELNAKSPEKPEQDEKSVEKLEETVVKPENNSVKKLGENVESEEKPKDPLFITQENHTEDGNKATDITYSQPIFSLLNITTTSTTPTTPGPGFYSVNLGRSSCANEAPLFTITNPNPGFLTNAHAPSNTTNFTQSNAPSFIPTPTTPTTHSSFPNFNLPNLNLQNNGTQISGPIYTPVMFLPSLPPNSSMPTQSGFYQQPIQSVFNQNGENRAQDDYIELFFKGICQQVKNANIPPEAFLDLQSNILKILSSELSKRQ